jgi:hypothetical protein
MVGLGLHTKDWSLANDCVFVFVFGVSVFLGLGWFGLGSNCFWFCSWFLSRGVLDGNTRLLTQLLGLCQQLLYLVRTVHEYMNKLHSQDASCDYISVEIE